MGWWLMIGIGLIAPFFMIKYREALGDTIGEAEWMRPVGGIYFIIIVIALFIFFWALAAATGTMGFLFGPIKYLIPDFSPDDAGGM